MKKVKKKIKLPPIQLDLENGGDFILDVITRPPEGIDVKRMLECLETEESWK